MSEISLYAFSINGYYNSKPADIPSALYRHIANTSFINRWSPIIPIGSKATPGIQYRNIVDFTHYTAEQMNHLIYFGELVEMSSDDIELININGNKTTHQLGGNDGVRKSWNFLIAPNLNLLIIAGTAVNQKLAMYLNGTLNEFYNINPHENKIDDIQIFIKPTEANPEGYFNTNPELGSVEFKLDSAAFKTDYGLLQSGVLGDFLFGDTDTELVVKLAISTTRRGTHLPTVLTENLAEFIKKAEESKVILSANVSEMSNGKRLKSKRLLNVFQTENITFASDTELQTKMLNFAFKLIELEVDHGNEDKS